MNQTGFRSFLDKRLHLLKPVLLYALMNGTLFVVLGIPYLLQIFSYASLYQNTLFDYHQLKWLIVLYTVLNYVSYMLFLALLPVTLMALLLLCLPHRRLIQLMALLAYSLACLLLVIDGQLFQSYHFHLNPTLINFALQGEAAHVFDLSGAEIALACAGLAGLLTLQLMLSLASWRYATRAWRVVQQLVLFCLASLLLCFGVMLYSMTQKVNILTQQMSNLPLYHQVVSTLLPGKESSRIVYNFSENYFSLPTFSKKALHYPAHPLQCTPLAKPLNVVLLSADALRADAVNSKLMPNTHAFAKSSMQFLSHYSGGNVTVSGLFSLFYGLPGHYWTAINEQGIAPPLMTELKRQGYQRRVIWSSEMTNPAFDKSLYLGVSPLRTSHQPGKTSASWDKVTTKEALNYLAQAKAPFFLHVFYNSTHAYCQDNEFTKIYQPELQSCNRITWGKHAPRAPLYNRYKNAAHFIDGELANVLQGLKQQHLLDNTVVIITSDHGEEFNDTGLGYWGHAGNFTHYQLQVPLFIHWPGKENRVIHTRTSHYDLSATLLTHLLGCANPTHDYSFGQDLFAADYQRYPLLVSSYAYSGVVSTQGIQLLRRSGEIDYQTTEGKSRNKRLADKAILKSVLQGMNRFFSKNARH